MSPDEIERQNNTAKRKGKSHKGKGFKHGASVRMGKHFPKAYSPKLSDEEIAKRKAKMRATYIANHPHPR